MAKKRVIIVGTGPTGMFAALELSKNPQLEILMFDRGSFRETRTEDNLTSGWGGAGAFSDGKLSLPDPNFPKSLTVGGQLAKFIGEPAYLELVGYVNQIYTKFGGRGDIYEKNEQKIQEIVNKALTCDLEITPTRVRHFGSDLSPQIVKNIKELLEKRGVEIHLETPIKSIRKNGNSFLVRAGGKDAGIFRAAYVIVAPGRDGADWLAKLAETLGIEVQPRETDVDIGVRVEVPYHIFSPLTDYLYDPKIEFYPKPFEDKVRTFCTCPYGAVVIEKYRGLLTTVNGHSLFENRLSDNTNFALLVSSHFTEPFKEPLKYAGRISELANMLSGKVLIQRLGNLKDGRRSDSRKIAEGTVEPSLKEAVPGDLSYALPYRHLTSILKMLGALDKIAPGINGNNTLLYGNEVKFYSSRIKTSPELEAMENLFVGGDGAGITRGLVQSSASGVWIARAIAKRI